MLIHIGYPKTASTWFQTHYFTNKHGFFDLTRSFALNDIVLPKQQDFSINEVKSKLDKILLEKKDENLISVLSHEVLVGNPQSGGYNREEIAYRLKNLFNDPKILILIRKQDLAIYSTYKQYIRTGGKCNLNDYLNPPIDGRIPLFDFGYFEYDKVIKLYQNLFGSKNVYVIPFESFIQNKKNILTDLSNWLGIKDVSFDEEMLVKHENKSINGVGIYLKRYLNSLIGRRDSLNPSIPIRISAKNEIRLEKIINLVTKLFPHQMNEGINNRIINRIKIVSKKKYVNCNKRIEELTGLDLTLLGYEIK